MTSEKDIIKALKALKHSIKIDPASIERNRAKLLTYYQEQFPSVRKDLFFYFKPALITAVVLFFFVLSSSGLIVYAQKSSPGSMFYTLKRVYEKVALSLMPDSQKPVLRAEMVVRRFDEVRNLVDKNGEKNSLTIQEATHDLEKEIAALKEEISSEKIVFGSDSPIRDGKKIIDVFKNKDIDIDKILSETKEAIQEKNIEMAMEKINQVEKIFSDLGAEEIETEIEEEATELIQPAESTETSKIIPVETGIEPTTEIKQEVEIILPVKKVDFSVDLIQENK